MKMQENSNYNDKQFATLPHPHGRNVGGKTSLGSISAK